MAHQARGDEAGPAQTDPHCGEASGGEETSGRHVGRNREGLCEAGAGPCAGHQGKGAPLKKLIKSRVTRVNQSSVGNRNAVHSSNP